jgi:subtilase family serine protease
VDKIVGANGGEGMTIAVVDAYHYANAEADLTAFSAAMGLPSCTSASGCFTQVWTPGTPSNSGWELEEMLDLEYAHAMAPKAKILMVETYDNYFDTMAAGVQYAYANADIVTNSYGAPEVYLDAPTEAYFDAIYVQSPVPLFFSSGDDGAYYTGYPCTSPYVTCIGGTSLYVNASLQRTSESAWSAGGGACSLFEAAPGWQSGYGSCAGMRATPDISAVADPNTGVAVLDTGNGGWYQVGGTSLSSPLLAGIFADIMAARASFGKPAFGFLNPVIYAGATRNFPYFYFDVTTGNNGNPATVGYDLATGLGVPKGPAMGNRFFGLVYNPVD